MSATRPDHLRKFAEQVRGGLAVRLLWRELIATHGIDDAKSQEINRELLASVGPLLALLLELRAAEIEEAAQGETRP